MAAESIGRKLGIGLRLAARAVQQRAAPIVSQAGPAVSTAPPRLAAATNHATSRAKGVARGAKRFGEAVWGPVVHSGSVLFLEVTGLFFALLSAYFGQNAYKFRQTYFPAPGRFHFVLWSPLTLCLALTLLFAFFAVSAFFNARRKEMRSRTRPADPLLPKS